LPNEFVEMDQLLFDAKLQAADFPIRAFDALFKKPFLKRSHGGVLRPRSRYEPTTR
jgi:hypothetical protein